MFAQGCHIAPWWYLSSEVIYDDNLCTQPRLYIKNDAQERQFSPGLLQDFSDYSLIFLGLLSYHDCSPGRYLGRAVVECRSSVCSSGPPRCQFRPSLADRGSEKKFPICPTVRFLILYRTGGDIFQLPVIVEYQALSKYSIGIFVNILNNYKKDWKLQFIKFNKN